jgi:hypothetical protein
VAQVHCGHILNKFVKETFELFHNLPAGQLDEFYLITFSIYPATYLPGKLINSPLIKLSIHTHWAN